MSSESVRSSEGNNTERKHWCDSRGSARTLESISAQIDTELQRERRAWEARIGGSTRNRETSFFKLGIWRKSSKMSFLGLRSLASLKLKDVPTFVKTTVTRDNVSKKTWGFLYNYNDKYIRTGSIKPLNDMLVSVLILGYVVGWPTELRHLKHAEEAEKHKAEGGGADHH